MNHHVTRFDPAELAVPAGYDGHSYGFRRASHIDRSVGAVHTGFGTCELAAGGEIDAHVHSYEEFAYVVEGNPVLNIDGCAVRLAPDECAFLPVGRRALLAQPDSRAVPLDRTTVAAGADCARSAGHVLRTRPGSVGG